MKPIKQTDKLDTPLMIRVKKKEKKNFIAMCKKEGLSYGRFLAKKLSL